MRLAAARWALGLSILVWLMAPVAGFFFFFGDNFGGGPDPRDRPLAVFLATTVIVMVGVIILAAKGRKGNPKLALSASLIAAAWLSVATLLLVALWKGRAGS
jgi:hypothetical protein